MTQEQPNALRSLCPLWVKSGLSSQYRFMSALHPKADISAPVRQGGFMSARPRWTGIGCSFPFPSHSSAFRYLSLPPQRQGTRLRGSTFQHGITRMPVSWANRSPAGDRTRLSGVSCPGFPSARARAVGRSEIPFGQSSRRASPVLLWRPASPKASSAPLQASGRVKPYRRPPLQRDGRP
jgi:hypothetical protein